AAASIALMGLCRELGLQMQLLRIFHVYGEGEPPTRFWPSLRRSALAGEDFPMTPGGQLRDFITVEAVASHFVQALACDGVEPGMPVIQHVASGRPMTLLEFAQKWWTVWQARSALRPGELAYRSGEIMRLVSAPECALGTRADSGLP
ncbi:MAG: hypothetical protein RLZZ271_965, partial [Pseudomonadota bacterium]